MVQIVFYSVDGDTIHYIVQSRDFEGFNTDSVDEFDLEYACLDRRSKM